ncbi:YdaS family helix-turn-helix protein [Bordetella sp. FB-8]|uniref:YdaS family helix-turn-helix protein n=1 Tax=Bordetella sp. FB-8 TaxID=1159870 RepID=UPI0005253F93|nr:YdaS family helix-turn-helix protein [Bordetella sp. FB-8]
MTTDEEVHRRQVLVKAALRNAGGVSRWARFFGIARTSIYDWIKKGEVPMKRALTIEKESRGLARRQELRPGDYWECWPELEAPSPDKDEKQ